MVKINTTTVPPGLLPTLKKSLRLYGPDEAGIAGGYNHHKTRSAQAALNARQYYSDIAAAWDAIKPAGPPLWVEAGTYCNRSGYRAFLADYAYRKRNGLSLPGTPNNNHQMQALVLEDSDGSQNITAKYTHGPILHGVTLTFAIATPVYDHLNPPPCTITIIGTYTIDAVEYTDENTYTGPVGVSAWARRSLAFLQQDHDYDKLEVIINQDQRQAKTMIDNLLIESSAGYEFSEYFNPPRPHDWDPVLLSGGVGWEFSPGYPSDNIYLEYGG